MGGGGVIVNTDPHTAKKRLLDSGGKKAVAAHAVETRGTHLGEALHQSQPGWCPAHPSKFTHIYPQIPIPPYSRELGQQLNL